MKISKSDGRMRIFPHPIHTVSSLNGQRTSTIEPWILRRKRFSRRRNESAHPIDDYSSHFIGRSRSVFRVKAVTPIVVSVEATQCPPVSPIKVPEKTHRLDGAVGEKVLKLRDIRLWSDLPIRAKVVYFKREGLVVKHRSSVFKNWLGRSGMCVGSLISCSRSLRMLNDSASSPPKSV